MLVVRSASMIQTIQFILRPDLKSRSAEEKDLQAYADLKEKFPEAADA
jgi:hypothetical protein